MSKKTNPNNLDIYSYVIVDESNNTVNKVEVKKVFKDFSSWEEIEDFYKHFEDKKTDTYLIMKHDEDGKIIDVDGVLFSFEDGSFFVDGAEHDFRVDASVAFGKDFNI